jgi:hypothetical protein
MVLAGGSALWITVCALKSTAGLGLGSMGGLAFHFSFSFVFFPYNVERMHCWAFGG